MNTKILGNKEDFAIEYTFLDKTRETEISMYIQNNNILEFEKNGKCLTTRWELDELAEWLRNFLNNMQEDPYPVDVDGQFAAEKDTNARDFDSDDEDEFDAYYDMLYEWDLHHRWHPASCGAILADVFFQLVGDNVEISWNNTECEENVKFKSELGGSAIPREEFVSVIDGFLKAYANHWYSLK